jgi:hypothetical protein
MLLCATGLLNAHILTHLRKSDIQRLHLSASIIDHEGLNLAGQDIFYGTHFLLCKTRSHLRHPTVFSKPNSFLHLTELSFNSTQLDDFSLVHIQHLPKLATLLLDCTGISNEALGFPFFVIF